MSSFLKFWLLLGSRIPIMIQIRKPKIIRIQSPYGSGSGSETLITNLEPYRLLLLYCTYTFAPTAAVVAVPVPAVTAAAFTFQDQSEAVQSFTRYNKIFQ